MLAINLLPEELRIQKKSSVQLPYLKYAIIGGVVFMLVTVSFYFDYLSAVREFNEVEKTWKTIQPQSQQLKALETEVETVIKPERNFLSRHVVTGRPMTGFMISLSELLPDTSWLTEVKMEQKDGNQSLFVKGVVLPSKNSTGIEAVEKYVHELQLKVPEAKLSLTTTRQKIADLEVTQFIANFEWKTGTV